MFSKRYPKGIILAVGMISLFVVLACSPKKDSESASGKSGSTEKIKIDFWHSQSGDTADYIAELAGTFNASQNIYEVVPVTYGNYAKTYQAAVAAYRAKKQPAIIHINEVTTADMLASGIYVSYQELMTRENLGENWGDYISGVQSYYSDASGELQAFPFNPSTILLYVNQDMLQQVGAEAPDTWEDFETTLKSLKAAGLPGYAARLHSWYQMEQVLAVNNAPIANKDNGYGGLDAELQFNNSYMVKNLENLKRWREEGLLTFQSAMGGGTTVEAFQSQKAAFVMASAGSYAGLLNSIGDKFDWTVYPIPHFTESPRYNSLVGGGVLWILKGLPEEQYPGVAKFFSFLLQTENQIGFVRNTGFLPTHTSIYKNLEEQGLLAEKEYAGVKVSIESLQNNKSSNYNKGIHLGFFPQIRNIWKNKTEGFLQGNFSAQEAMDQAVAEGNEQLRKFAKIYQ